MGNLDATVVVASYRAASLIVSFAGHKPVHKAEDAHRVQSPVAVCHNGE